MAFITSISALTSHRPTNATHLLLHSTRPRTTFVTSPTEFRKHRVQPSQSPLWMAASRDSSSPPPSVGLGKLSPDRDPATVNEDEWRQLLTDKEFKVIRGKGTEYPGTGEYDSFYPKQGYFVCRACGNPLYSADAKFKSGCGWPSFDKCYDNAIKTEVDMSFGQRRIEIMCNKCDAHLGHVFEGERFTETNERHCVNSISVTYVDAELDIQEGKLL